MVRLGSGARPGWLRPPGTKRRRLSGEEREQPALHVGGHTRSAGAQLWEPSLQSGFGKRGIDFDETQNQPLKEAPYLRRCDFRALDRCEIDGSQVLVNLIALRAVERAHHRLRRTVVEKRRKSYVRSQHLAKLNA